MSWDYDNDPILPLKKGKCEFYARDLGGEQYGVYDSDDRLVNVYDLDDLYVLAEVEEQRRYEAQFGQEE